MVRNEILISLDDEGLGKVVDILKSKSARRILEILSEKDLSVSDISERLKMNLKTVDYNVSKLLRAGLIEKVSFLWSVKGRKVAMYRACNKKIVISPKRKVSDYLMGWLGLGVVALGLKSFGFGKEPVSQDVLRSVADVAPKAEMLQTFSAENVVAGGGSQVAGGVSFWMSLAGWEWFLFGVWVSVLVYFVYEMISERRKNN